MILVSLIRILKFAVQDIARNFWLSLITVTILVLALFSINFLITIGVVGRMAIATVEQKVDLGLYLKPIAAEADISALQAELTGLSGVTQVTYVSKQEALEAFQRKHEKDPEVLESLRELNGNPLNPSLTVTAASLDDYERIIARLDTLQQHELIESRNFDDHRALLTSLETVVTRLRQVAIVISVIFIVVTVLVIFNAVRVALYTHQKEIRIMKLVGASNSFIRAPFLLESVLYALAGTIGVAIIIYPFLRIMQPYLGAFFTDSTVDVVDYFQKNALAIFGWQFLSAAGVSMAACILALRRYLRT